MNGDLQRNLGRLGLRLLGTAPLWGLGFYWLFSLGTVFYGAALLIIAGMIVAFPLAELFARPLTAFYFPTEGAKPTGNCSIPEARVKQGRYEEAMQEYEKITTAHPQEVRAHIGMVEIAFRYLHDADRAGRLYARAMNVLQKHAAQAALHQAYTAHRSWFENPPR
jgi:tetratricopeptide (TPR) repeat protein